MRVFSPEDVIQEFKRGRCPVGAPRAVDGVAQPASTMAPDCGTREEVHPTSSPLGRKPPDAGRAQKAFTRRGLKLFDTTVNLVDYDLGL